MSSKYFSNCLAEIGNVPLLPYQREIELSQIIQERRCFEFTPGRKLIMAGMYFGLIVCLLLGMAVTRIVPGR